MSNHIDPKMQEIRDRHAAATPGPWYWEVKNPEQNKYGGYDVGDLTRKTGEKTATAILTILPNKHGVDVISAFSIEDANLITNAPEYIAYLLSEYKRLQSENQGMKEALTEIEIERIRYDASRKVGGEFEDPDVFLLLDEVGRLREENKQLMTMAEDWQRQCVQALVERDKLRRALEEAYTDMMDALQVMEMEKRDFSLMPQCTIKDAAAKLGKLLYPAGEDDTQKVTVTLHNRGYEKHELDFGEGDK